MEHFKQSSQTVQFTELGAVNILNITLNNLKVNTKSLEHH